MNLHIAIDIRNYICKDYKYTQQHAKQTVEFIFTNAWHDINWGYSDKIWLLSQCHNFNKQTFLSTIAKPQCSTYCSICWPQTITLNAE